MFDIMKINLQVFANEVQTTLLPGLSVENKTYYDMTLIDEAQAALVHDQFAQKRDIPKNGGKTIEFRKFASLPKAMTALTEGVTPDGKSLTVTAITATVSQYGDYITMSDMLDLTAIDPVVVEATKILGRQAGLTLDTVTRNVLQSGTNVSYCPKIGEDGAETAVTSRGDLDATCQLTVNQSVNSKLSRERPMDWYPTIERLETICAGAEGETRAELVELIRDLYKGGA